MGGLRLLFQSALKGKDRGKKDFFFSSGFVVDASQDLPAAFMGFICKWEACSGLDLFIEPTVRLRPKIQSKFERI